MNTIASAVILVTVLVGVAISGQIVFRLFVKEDSLVEHHGPAEAMLGVVGTLYSVLLGFLVAGAMEKYAEAKMHTEMEANGVANIFRLARGLEQEDRLRLRNLCRDYSNEVVTIEWPIMESRGKINHNWQAYQKLWEAVVSVNPLNERQINLHAAVVQAMEDVGMNRRTRILIAKTGPSTTLWIVLGIGAFITIGFTFVFSSKWAAIQALMTSLVAATLGLNMWLLAVYSTPFSGDLKINPDMFELLKENVFNTPDTPARYIHDDPLPASLTAPGKPSKQATPQKI
ncbi:DUF4239 domain-containing protein [bacterium]|nr:DUF4239 domain-containing protein [bacterium]